MKASNIRKEEIIFRKDLVKLHVKLGYKGYTAVTFFSKAYHKFESTETQCSS